MDGKSSGRRIHGKDKIKLVYKRDNMKGYRYRVRATCYQKRRFQKGSQKKISNVLSDDPSQRRLI
ncbi:hypothetical protein ACF0H5_015826 [Mactra antiquata]